MKYEKTNDDLKVEQYDLRNNRTMKHLRNANHFKFQVGDVLIKEVRCGDEWKVEEASCGLPHKYVYAFENELGLGYIRRLSVTGNRFVDNILCVLELDPDTCRFQLDPAYADHILLNPDEELDVKSEYAAIRSKKSKVRRLNEKLRHKFATEDEAEKFLKTMSPGDKFWYGRNSTSIEKEAYVVVAVDQTKPYYSSPVRAYIKYKPFSATGPHVYERNLYTSNLVWGWFLTSEPHCVSDLL